MQSEPWRAVRLRRIGARQQRHAGAEQYAGQFLIFLELLTPPFARRLGQTLTQAIGVPVHAQPLRHMTVVGMAIHLFKVRQEQHVLEHRQRRINHDLPFRQRCN